MRLIRRMHILPFFNFSHFLSNTLFIIPLRRDNPAVGSDHRHEGEWPDDTDTRINDFNPPNAYLTILQFFPNFLSIKLSIIPLKRDNPAVGSDHRHDGEWKLDDSPVVTIDMTVSENGMILQCIPL